MKRLLLIALPLLLIVGCSKPINDETLIEKDGLKYHPDTKELYSGKVFQNRMGGEKEFEGSYKDGKEDGLWTSWYQNGQKKEERTYKGWKQDGLWTLWYENGQKKEESTYKDGNGFHIEWYENGQKKLERNYKDGNWIQNVWNVDGDVLKRPAISNEATLDLDDY
jgi:antitoxin component YwqK of YwqJK toxin-antitoxin module